ncbi:MAG: alpha/beta fold hydrolase [Polyangiaceae bacterium]
MDRAPSAPPPFRPSLGLRSAFLQTIVGTAPVWVTRPPAERMRVPVDGGAIHVHVTFCASERAPVVLLVHGIGGASDSLYMLRAVAPLLAAGYHVARLDLRGAGESLADAPSLYHAGLSSDLDAVAAYLATDARVSAVALLGFSLGGNLVLKLASEWGAAPPSYARAVVAISPLVDLGPTSTALETRATTVYRVYVVRSLLAMAQSFSRRHPSRAIDLTGLSARSTVRDYDRAVVVPMHGFGTVERYYQSASAGPKLGAITVPTLFAFAKDDPMIPLRTVEPWAAKASPAVRVLYTDRGGHVGWFESLSREGFERTWGIRRALEHFKAAFSR